MTRYRAITESDGEFYKGKSDFVSDITIAPQSGCTERGLYFPQSKTAYTHASRHENIDDLISTTVHESLHGAIDLILEWESEDDDKETILDDRKEHRIISVLLNPDWYI